jgi:hypothetical protein
MSGGVKPTADDNIFPGWSHGDMGNPLLKIRHECVCFETLPVFRQSGYTGLDEVRERRHG